MMPRTLISGRRLECEERFRRCVDVVFALWRSRAIMSHELGGRDEVVQEKDSWEEGRSATQWGYANCT